MANPRRCHLPIKRSEERRQFFLGSVEVKIENLDFMEHCVRRVGQKVADFTSTYTRGSPFCSHGVRTVHPFQICITYIKGSFVNDVNVSFMSRLNLKNELIYLRIHHVWLSRSMYEDLKVLASIVTVRQTSQSNGKKS